MAALPVGYDVQRVDDPTPEISGNFGQNIASVGDLDGDGYEDLLAGTDKHGRRLGQAHVISGVDGTIVRELERPDTDPGGSGERQSGFGAAVGRIGVNQAVGPFLDMGSCPAGDGADADAACDDNPIGAADGIPDLLVTASGVDIDPATGTIDPAENNDLGVAYVFDGESGALLHRLMMPAGDRVMEDALRATALETDPRFGRAALSPGARPPCDRNGNATPGGGNGISLDASSSCGSVAPAVEAGDLDGGGTADVVVAATDFDEEAGGPGVNPASDCASAAAGTDCPGAGRAYVWFGEAIAGGDPNGVDDTPDLTISDPYSAPFDSERASGTRIGTTIIPLGDVGACAGGPTAGELCTSTTNTPDGSPEYALTGPDYDIPGAPGAGTAFVIDGASGAIARQLDHPEPQPVSAWGLAQNGLVQPAFGDLGQSGTWDLYVPGTHQNEGGTAVGKGYVMNGQLNSRDRFTPFAQLWDPTPNSSGNFGASAGGVGDVFGAVDGGSVHGEVIVGAIGPHAPGTNPNVSNDVHIFNPITEQALQTVADPDGQPGSSFGGGVAPLGDVNDDGFLDFAASSGLYDLTTAGAPCSPAACTNAGRVYIFRSDNTPPPSEPPPEEEPPAETIAGRALVLDANRAKVRKGKRVRLRGLLEAFANEDSCVGGQPVALQQRRPGKVRFETFAEPTTDAAGEFSHRFKPRRTTIFRARAGQSDQCMGAASDGVRVEVKKGKKGKNAKGA
jgi:hypothetical protein